VGGVETTGGQVAVYDHEVTAELMAVGGGGGGSREEEDGWGGGEGGKVVVGGDKGVV